MYPYFSLSFVLGSILAPYIFNFLYSIYTLKNKLIKKKNKLTFLSDYLYYQNKTKKLRE